MLKDKLKQLRKYNSLTQEQLSQILNIQRSTYAYYELGRSMPKFETLKMLAEIYKIPVTDFLDIGDDCHVLHSDPDPELLPAIDAEILDDKLLQLSNLSYDEQLLVLKYRLQKNKSKFWQLAQKTLTD